MVDKQTACRVMTEMAYRKTTAMEVIAIQVLVIRVTSVKILGHPNGLRSVSNGVATVQEESFSDVVSGDEAHRQNVNLHGELKGSCHATRLSTIAYPTIGLQVHPFIR